MLSHSCVHSKRRTAVGNQFVPFFWHFASAGSAFWLPSLRTSRHWSLNSSWCATSVWMQPVHSNQCWKHQDGVHPSNTSIGRCPRWVPSSAWPSCSFPHGILHWWPFSSVLLCTNVIFDYLFFIFKIFRHWIRGCREGMGRWIEGFGFVRCTVCPVECWFQRHHAHEELETTTGLIWLIFKEFFIL